MGRLERVRLLVVDAIHAVFRQFSARLVRARENRIGLDTRHECRSAWNRCTQLLALNFLLVAPEDVLRLLHALLLGPPVDNRLAVVEERSPIGFKVGVLDDCVGVGGVHAEELVDGPRADWLFFAKETRKRYTMI